MRRFIAVLATTSALWASASPPAAAHRAVFESRVTINGDTIAGGTDVLQVTGFVKSEKKACRGDRYVELYRPNGDFYGADPASDPNGAWSIDGTGPPGRYRAKVLTYDLPSGGGHKHVCARDSIRKLVD